MSEGEFFTSNGKILSLRVRARPGAREDAVLGVRAGELVIAVRAVAEKGKANNEIVRTLSRALGVPRDSITLRMGAVSPHKVFHAPLSCEAALRRLVGEKGNL